MVFFCINPTRCTNRLSFVIFCEVNISRRFAVFMCNRFEKQSAFTMNFFEVVSCYTDLSSFVSQMLFRLNNYSLNNWTLLLNN